MRWGWGRQGTIVRLGLGLGLAVALGAWGAAPAWAQTPTGVTWTAVPVRAPVSLDAVSALPPYVFGNVPEVRGEVEVGPSKGAAFWLTGLEVVQLRADPGSLRFHRLTGGSASTDAWLRVEEPGLPVRSGVWYLAEPVGAGSIWVVTAVRPTKLWVERPAVSDDPHMAEALRREVLLWVDGQAPMPALPFHAEVRHALQWQAELGEALVRGVPGKDPLHDAVRAWRKASALRALWTVQPLSGQGLRTQWHGLPGEDVDFDGFIRPFVRVASEGVRELEVEGPGVLALEARAVSSEGAVRPEPVVEVTTLEGEVLGAVMPPVKGARLGEDEAVPATREVRTLPSGEVVGIEESVRLALAPGKQTLRLRWHGGTVLLRVRSVMRRPLFTEQLRGVTDWPDWAQKAHVAAAKSAQPSATLLQDLLARLEQAASAGTSGWTPRSQVPVSPGSSRVDGLSPELRAFALLEAAEGAHGAREKQRLALEAKAALEDGWADKHSLLAWSLRLRCARLLVHSDLEAQARAFLRAPGELPASGTLLAEAADVLLQLSGSGAWRSRALGALELAHRQEPLSLDIARRYRSAFYRQGRWATVTPEPPDERPRPLPARWLDLVALEDDDAPGNGAHFALEPGMAVRLPGSGGPDVARILRAFVVTPSAEGEAPPVLHVDRLRISLMPLSPVEPVEVALPQGEHVVRLEARAGTRAWLSIGPSHAGTGAWEEVAYLRQHYPARTRGRSLQFPVPDAEVPGPVRLQLRAPPRQDGKPVGLWIRTDVGQPRRAVLFPGSPSARHLAVDERPGPGGSAAQLVLHLPAHAREVWLEPDEPDARLFVSVAVRRPPRSAEELLASRTREPPPADEAMVTRLLELSRTLQGTHEGAAALLERAELLLDAGEEAWARDDLVRALSRQNRLTGDEAERLAALLDRVEAAPQDTGRFVTPVSGPVLLFPGSPALQATDEERGQVAKRVRGKTPEEALAALGQGQSPLERYVRARLYAAQMAPEKAALELLRLYRDGEPLPVGMEALWALERVQTLPSAWSDWGAPMGVALTSRLEATLDLPSVRRVRHAARRFARWERLRDADAHVGSLDLLLDAKSEPHEQLFLALHAPPWPLAGTRVMRPGHAAVLSLAAPEEGEVGAEAVCQAVRADVRPRGKVCRFALRVDNRIVARRAAKVGEVVRLSAQLPPGSPHQLELDFDAAAGTSAVARFVAGQRALEAQAPMPVLRARPGVPVELSVLGPTAVRLEARAFAQEGVLTVTDGEGRTPRVLTLSGEQDAKVHGAPFKVGPAQEAWLLLPDEGPHRLQFVADGGEALVRVGLGGTRKPSALRAEWWTRAPTALEPLPWPELPESLALLPSGSAPANEPGCGTWSAGLGLRGEYLDEGELDRPLEGRLQAGGAFRCELSARRAWLYLSPEVRHSLDRSPAFGGTAGVHVRGLPWKLRGTAFGSVFAQSLGAGLRYSARLRGSVDRWIGLTPDLGLIPGVRVTVEHLGGGVSTGASALAYDRSVYWRYGEQHPVRPSPRLSLRWQPLQDGVGMLSTWAVTNPELVTLDHASARAMWTALMPFYPNARGSLAYEASYRLADAHRPLAYLRHGPRARLDVGFWRGSTGRLMLYAEDALWFGTPQGIQNTLTFGVRWDFTRGRGLRDFMPFEEELEELVGGAP